MEEKTHPCTIRVTRDWMMKTILNRSRNGGLWRTSLWVCLLSFGREIDVMCRYFILHVILSRYLIWFAWMNRLKVDHLTKWVFSKDCFFLESPSRSVVGSSRDVMGWYSATLWAMVSSLRHWIDVWAPSFHRGWAVLPGWDTDNADLRFTLSKRECRTRPVYHNMSKKIRAASQYWTCFQMKNLPTSCLRSTNQMTQASLLKFTPITLFCKHVQQLWRQIYAKEAMKRMTRVTITDTKPEIFCALLRYVYGIWGELSRKLLTRIISKESLKEWRQKLCTSSQPKSLFFADTKKYMQDVRSWIKYLSKISRNQKLCLPTFWQLWQWERAMIKSMMVTTLQYSSIQDYDHHSTLRRILCDKGPDIDGTREILIVALEGSY